MLPIKMISRPKFNHSYPLSKRPSCINHKVALKYDTSIINVCSLFCVRRPNSSFCRSTQEEAPKRKLSIPERIVESSPELLKPYLRLGRYDKPIGAWLLLWPCIWSLTISSPLPYPNPDLFLLFTAGALLTRGAGCTVNDLYDRNFDRKVQRTKTRPIASGAVTERDAIFFVGIQLGWAFLILLQMNSLTIMLGVCSLCFVGTYPLFKRFTNWPQLMLGLTFNYGIFMAYSATVGYVDLTVTLPMYIAGIFWTLIYDTIYAHQDKADDVFVGVKSTALLFGDKTQLILNVFCVGFLLSLLLVGTFESFAREESAISETFGSQHRSSIIDNVSSPAATEIYRRAEEEIVSRNHRNQGAPFNFFIYGSLVGVAFTHLLWVINSVDYQKPESCMKGFIANRWTGFIVFLAVLLSRQEFLNKNILTRKFWNKK